MANQFLAFPNAQDVLLAFNASGTLTGIQYSGGFVSLVGGGYTGPMIEDLNGVTLGVNDILKGNVASVGTPGGAGATVGVAQLNTLGNLVAPSGLSYTTNIDLTFGTLLATGINQSTAAAITKTVTSCTASSGTTGVVLPAGAAVGEIHVVENNSAFGLHTYPSSGASIDAMAVNAPTVIPAELTVWFAYDGTNWESIVDCVGTTNGALSITHSGGVVSINTLGFYAPLNAGVGAQTALVPGDQLAAGVASSGTVGSGSAIVGIATLNSAGNFVGNWIPYSNTLSFLEGYAGIANQVGVATDIPALALFNGTAGQAQIVFPYRSASNLTVATTSATLPVDADILRLTVTYTGANLTLTFANGYIDGQIIELDMVATPATLNGTVTVNGGVWAGTAGVTCSLIPGSNPVLRAQYQWQASSSSWVLCSELDSLRSASDNPLALNYGTSNIATGPNAITLGYVCAATDQYAVAVGVQSDAKGVKSYAAGYASSAYGAYSAAFIGSAYADYSFGFGYGSTAYGAFSTAFAGNGFIQGVYGPYCFSLGGGNGLNFFNFVYGNASMSLAAAGTGNQAQAWSYTGVSGTPTAPTFTGVTNGAAPFNLEAGQSIVVLSNAASGGVYLYGTISSVVGTTVVAAMINTLNTVAANRPSGVGYPSSGTIFECSSGYQSVAVGGGAQALNNGETVIAPFQINVPGDNQYQYESLGIQTTSATPVVATLTGTAVNTKLAIGNSNRLIIPPGQTVSCLLTVVGKQAGSANSIHFRRSFLATNNGGSITLSALSSVGSDVGIGTTQWTTTWVASPPFTVAANNTYQSVDTTITALASTTIVWRIGVHCETVTA